MLEALLISNVILWMTVIGLAAVVVALIRQVGVLNERVAPAGALVGHTGPRVGELAPRFELADWSGRPVTIGGVDREGSSTLLLFVSPTCPVCATLLPIVESVARAEPSRPRLVLASDGAPEEHGAFVQAHDLQERRYVLSTPLGLAYQVAKLPYAVLISADGIVRAKGLVNTREHLESLFEAMTRGVGSIQEYVQRERNSRRVA